MRQLDLKKLLLPNLPYLLIGLYATKLGEAWWLAPGADVSAKLLGLMDGFAAAFQSALPSFHPVDLLVGLCCGAALRLAVYIKGKNAKKYRKNMEYGSARWFVYPEIHQKVLDNCAANALAPPGLFFRQRKASGHEGQLSDFRFQARHPCLCHIRNQQRFGNVLDDFLRLFHGALRQLYPIAHFAVLVMIRSKASSKSMPFPACAWVSPFSIMASNCAALI